MLSHEEQIVGAIRQIIRAVDLQSRRLVNVHGLTGPQLAVLQEIRRVGQVPPRELSRSVHLSQPTVTGILQRLERRGLVVRQQSQSDRRSVLFTATEDGEQLLAAAPSLLQDRFRAALSSLPEWEQLQILATLQRVASLMEAGDLDAAPRLFEDEGTATEPPAETDSSPVDGLTA